MGVAPSTGAVLDRSFRAVTHAEAECIARGWTNPRSARRSRGPAPEHCCLRQVLPFATGAPHELSGSNQTVDFER
jgi:hypothetical protein